MDASQVGNAYEHALRELATAQAENARMRTALEEIAVMGPELSEFLRNLGGYDFGYYEGRGRCAAIAERALTAGSGNE